MPFQNQIDKHFTPAEKEEVFNLLNALSAILKPKFQNLDDKQNRQYASIGVLYSLFIEKVNDYRQIEPNLSSNDVDWEEFAADFETRRFLQGVRSYLNGLLSSTTETQRLYDSDNFRNAKIDYDYTKYKNTTEKTGYDSKLANLQALFPSKGKKKKPKEATKKE